MLFGGGLEGELFSWIVPVPAGSSVGTRFAAFQMLRERVDLRA
jgi:hypothetical protein